MEEEQQQRRDIEADVRPILDEHLAEHTRTQTTAKAVVKDFDAILQSRLDEFLGAFGRLLDTSAKVAEELTAKGAKVPAKSHYSYGRNIESIPMAYGVEGFLRFTFEPDMDIYYLRMKELISKMAAVKSGAYALQGGETYILVENAIFGRFQLIFSNVWVDYSLVLGTLDILREVFLVHLDNIASRYPTHEETAFASQVAEETVSQVFDDASIISNTLFTWCIDVANAALHTFNTLEAKDVWEQTPVLTNETGGSVKLPFYGKIMLHASHMLLNFRTSPYVMYTMDSNALHSWRTLMEMCTTKGKFTYWTTTVLVPRSTWRRPPVPVNE